MGNIFSRLLISLFNYKPISVIDVFTPTKAAIANYVERPDIEKLINTAISVPGKQLLVFGHSGSGKTTIVRRLLDNCERVFERTQCSKDTTFEQILLEGFDKLDKFFVSEKSYTNKHKVSANVEAEYSLIKSKIGTETSNSNTTTLTRILPVQLTSQKLAEFYGESGIVWVIEDFHKVTEVEKKKLADMLKIFVDNANDYPSAKIICIGACENANDLIRLEPNLKNRVNETKVHMLSDEEIRKIVLNGCRLLNVTMEESLVEKIVYYSARIGSSAHQMCLDICLAKGINKRQRTKIVFRDADFEHAVNGFIKSNEGNLSVVYDNAIKNDLEWYVLKSFSDNWKEKLSLKDIKNYVNENAKGYKDSDIKKKLEELCNTEIGVVYYHKNSDKYSLASPFWEAFLRMQFAYEDSEKMKAELNSTNPNLKLINQRDIDAAVNRQMLELIIKLRRLEF